MPLTSQSFRTKAWEQLSPPTLSGGTGSSLTAPALCGSAGGDPGACVPDPKHRLSQEPGFGGARETASRMNTKELRKGGAVGAQDACGGVGTEGPESPRLRGHG